MEKKPFVTKEQLEEITKTYPTPFHLYDEKGIRENARQLKEAFSWNKGYKEYFAVKATPNPFILNILKEYGCGTDCSSMTELMMSKACGFSGNDISFLPMIRLWRNLPMLQNWGRSSIWMILPILSVWSRRWGIFLRPSAVALIPAVFLRSAMILWIILAIPSTV